MPLDKVKKTVLFNKGMSDDHDRFLVEPPALDRTINLRAHKTGSLEKRPGFGPDELTSVPNPSGDPFFLHAVGDTLYAFTEDGAQAYNGTWNTVASDGFLGTRSTVLETQSLHGLTQVQYAPAVDNDGTTILAHWVAYEVMETDQPRNPAFPDIVRSKHVVVVEFDSEGKFVTQTRIDEAHSPVLKTIPGLPGSFVFFVDQTTDELKFQRSGFPVVSLTPAITVDSEQGFPLFWTGTSGVESVGTAPRLGQGEDHIGRYHVEWCPTAGVWAVAYQFSQQVIFATFNVVGVRRQSVASGIVGRKTPLSIAYAGTDAGLDEIVVLYVVWDVDFSEDWSVRLRHMTVGPSSLSLETDDVVDSGTATPDSMTGPTITHGTVASAFEENGIRRAMIVLTSAGASNYNPNDVPTFGGPQGAYKANVYAIRSNTAGVRMYFWDYNTHNLLGYEEVHGHRVATNAVYFENDWYVGMQQWADYTPHAENIGNVQHFADIFPALKPVTTTLCKIDDTNFVLKTRPVAYVDPAQGQVCDYVQSELRVALQNLHVIDGAFLLANRFIVEPSDISYAMGTVLGNWSRVPRLTIGAKAGCRVHRIQKGWEQEREITGTFLGDGVALSTALPLWFDQSFFAEFSVLDSPEIMRINRAAWEPSSFGPEEAYSPETNFGVGNEDWRQMVAVYGYTDSKGNVHRSAPSTTVWHEVVDTVYVTPPLSAMSDDQEYWCEVYVNNSLGSDPQLVSVLTVPTDGTHRVLEIDVRPEQFVGKSGGYLLDWPNRNSKTVYTKGGVLASDPWPSFNLAVATSTRFWAIDENNRGRVLPSKLFEDYVAPEYNPTLAINLGDERNLTAIGKLDDKVIVFEPNDIHVIYGDGPDNRGQGQDFAVHYIATDVGCVDQQSVIETPVGLMFYSRPRGFYLLDRNLQVQFIGGGIEEIADSQFVNRIVTATLVPETAEVRFVIDGGTSSIDEYGPNKGTALATRPPRPRFVNRTPLGIAYVYNYEQGLWHMYGNYFGAAATMYQQKYTMLNQDWSIWQESETRFDDPTGENRTDMTTPWIKLGETVQDYHRLWRITFLGRYLSSLQSMGDGSYEAGDIEVLAWFDYENGPDAPVQRKRFRMQDFGFDPFNNPPKRAERLQFEFTPVRGRCQSIKLQIRELNSQDLGEGLSYSQGHGFEISALDFHIGVSPMRSLLPQRSKK